MRVESRVLEPVLDVLERAERRQKKWPMPCGLPLGGCAQKKGATGTRSNAIGARALYSPLSPPVSSTPGRSFGHGGDSPSSTPRASTGVLYTDKFPLSDGAGTPNEGNLGHASNTKGPLRRKTCTPKTAMTPVVATIRLRRSSPRSRGPPSQSESYVWDKALICRRPGESNSSI